jgi:hypothetical protein
MSRVMKNISTFRHLVKVPVRRIGLLAVLVLSGCAGVNYVQAKYQGLPSVEFVGTSGTNYRIVDNQKESRLLIGPGLAGSATPPIPSPVMLNVRSVAPTPSGVTASWST